MWPTSIEWHPQPEDLSSTFSKIKMVCFLFWIFLMTSSNAQNPNPTWLTERNWKINARSEKSSGQNVTNDSWSDNALMFYQSF